jgi:lipopolysaccharide/colanic/teichoic acid biosynthesis glycosyltransferase
MNGLSFSVSGGGTSWESPWTIRRPIPCRCRANALMILSHPGQIFSGAGFTYDEPRARRADSAVQAEVTGWKRALDIVLILMVLPLVAPVMVMIAALIRVVSPGPILFKQERVGYLGRRFMCYKFRTMAVNADTSVHQGHLNNLMRSDVPMVKMDAQGDPRVIRFGGPLRSSGLDELPQIINVIRGEMSLVGPRPCLPYEYENYLPWQKGRFKTVPGLTGLWQVSGKNRTTFARMIELDIQYAKTKTLWLDLKIILKTIPALIVQIQDIRKRKKAILRPEQAEAAVATRTADQDLMGGTAYTMHSSIQTGML